MRVRITPKNLEVLEQINNTYGLSITYLVNICIYERLGGTYKLLKEFNMANYSSKGIELKIRLYEHEKEYLQNSAKQTGTNSLTGEIRYRLLNSIYEKKFISPDEKIAFSQIKYELNMIGRNLHQILKKLNFNKNFEENIFKDTLLDLDEKLDLLKNHLENLTNYSKERV